MRPSEAAALCDGHQRVTTSSVSAQAKWHEHHIEEVKASSWIQIIELIRALVRRDYGGRQRLGE